MRQIDPRPFGELFNEWFRSLGRTWKPLLVTSLVPFAGVGIIVAVSFALTGYGEFFRTAMLEPDTLELYSSDEWIDLLIRIGIATFVWVLVTWVAGVFVHLAATWIVAQDAADAPYDSRSATDAALSRIGRGLGAQFIMLLGFLILFGLATAVGTLLIAGSEGSPGAILIFMGLLAGATFASVWLGISLSLALQAVMVEGRGVFSSLQRAFDLVQGTWWRTFGFILVVGLIASVAGQLVGIVLTPLFFISFVAPALFAIAYGLSAVLTGPTIAALAAGYTVWYVDLRARREPLTTEDLAARS